VGRPLWREDGSAVSSVITQWSESLRTRNHTLLSHLRLPQPGGPGPHICTPQEQGGPVIPPGTGFPLCRLLRLTGLQWRYCNPVPTWRPRSPYLYPPQEQGGPVIPPVPGLPLRHVDSQGKGGGILTLPQPGRPGPRTCTPQEQGGPVIPPGTGFPFLCLLWLTGLRWGYSNPPQTEGLGSHIYILPRTGWASYPPGTGFPSRFVD
jgi:hypothetical protein